MTNTDSATPSPEKKSAPKREGFLNSIWADITGGVITVVTGLISARHAINKAFYQNIKIVPKFLDEIKKSQEKTLEILDEVSKETELSGKHSVIMHKLPEQHKKYNKAIDTVLREEYGIRNLVDKSRLLRPHQKLEVLTKVGATVAVTLGAVATVAALRNMSNNQKDMEARLDGVETGANSRSL